MNIYHQSEYSAPRNMGTELDRSQWWIHSWNLKGQPVIVFHRESFRLKWFATKVVTFVFVIDRSPGDMASIEAEFVAMRQFASDHKRTWLPFGIQCGYALLPIYVGKSFSDLLIQQVRNRFKERWCMFHIPSLLDTKKEPCCIVLSF